MHTETHALSDAHLLRRDVFDPAHQAEAFDAIDQGDVERLALRGMHHGGRIDGAQPFADAPFQLVATGEGTEYARKKYRTPRFAAELIGQFIAGEMIEVCFERSVLVGGHRDTLALVCRGDQPRFVLIASLRLQLTRQPTHFERTDHDRYSAATDSWRLS